MSYDPNYFLNVLSAATGESEDWNKRRIKQENISDIKSELESHSYSLSQSQKRFLESYLNDLESHEEKAERIKLIKQNFSQIESIFDTLQQEVNEAREEERTLEELAKDLNDKKVQKKIKNYDKPEIEDLRKKLNHLLKMKKEMEDREQSLEAVSENFNHIAHALSQRVDLVNKIISEDGGSGGGGSSQTRIVSISDVHGIQSGFDECINLLQRSNNFPSFGSGNYVLVINGNAMNDESGVEGQSENMLYTLQARASSGNFVYTFGHTDQYILFKEFWCAMGLHGSYSEPYFKNIDESDREWFIEQTADSNGCITGVWNGNYEYNYSNAGNVTGSGNRVNNFNDKIETSAEEILRLRWDGSYNDPSDQLSDTEIQDILVNRMPTLIVDSSNNGLGQDLDPTNPGELEALIAIQYKIQFESYDEIPYDDCYKIFHPTDGALNTEWDDLASNDPGKFIVGRTESGDCSEGTSFFGGGSNPRHTNSEKVVNEKTVSSSDPNTVVIEEQGGDVTAIKENGSGNIEEETV